MDSSSVKGKRAIVIQKQVLPIGNNWRNTEICHRSGSVSHADPRWSLRHVSWVKEFAPYALNLNIRFISTGCCQAEQASKDKMYISGLIPTGTFGVRVGLCLSPVLPGLPGRLTSPFQGFLLWDYNLWNHTERSPTIQGTASTGPLRKARAILCSRIRDEQPGECGYDSRDMLKWRQSPDHEAF